MQMEYCPAMAAIFVSCLINSVPGGQGIDLALGE